MQKFASPSRGRGNSISPLRLQRRRGRHFIEPRAQMFDEQSSGFGTPKTRSGLSPPELSTLIAS
jgi:hypothetical protein